MKLETLEALQLFVMEVKHMTINDNNADIQKAGDELDSMLEHEINIKKAIKFVDQDESIDLDNIPEFLKRQSGAS